MPYKVIPFTADIVLGEGSRKAASQLEALVNAQSGEGWQFHGLEALETTITKPGTPGKPGTNGCMGIGAVEGVPAIPESRSSARVYVAVFERPDS